MTMANRTMATVEDQTYYLEKKDQADIICFAALIHQSHNNIYVQCFVNSLRS